MADIERIRREIEELAGRQNSVEFSEVERIVTQLGQNGYEVESKAGRHSHLFRVADQPFTVCKHNPRRKELKKPYVRSFLKAMSALGLLDEDKL